MVFSFSKSLREEQRVASESEVHTMNHAKAQKALRIAKKLAKQAKCATDLHNAFFGIGGKFGEMFPTRSEREAFAKTPEYKEIVQMRLALAQLDKAAP
jgi:hypothetical protein